MRNPWWPATLLVVALGSAAAVAQPPRELIFPIVVNGPSGPTHFQTTFVFFNLSATAKEVGIRAFRDVPFADNLLFCRPLINITPPFDPTLGGGGHLPGSGFLRVTSSGESPSLFTGWARFGAFPDQPVEASAELSLLGVPTQACTDGTSEVPPRIPVFERRSSVVRQSVRVPAVEPAREFLVEAVIGLARETAVAIVNPSLVQPATVRFELLDGEGRPLAENSGAAGAACIPEFAIPSLERLVGPVWTLYAAERLEFLGSTPCSGPRPDAFSGTARITSDQPIAVGALHVILPDGRLVDAPVVRVER